MRAYEPSGSDPRVGICLKTAQIDALSDLMFDYAEFPFSEIALLSEPGFACFCEQTEQQKLACPVMTHLLPKNGRVVDTDDPFRPFVEYLTTGFNRARQLGTRIVILGNAGARNVNRGFSRELALSRLLAFCQAAANLASEYDISICLEPLNRTQSNLINTVAEAAEIAAAAGRPNFGLVWDYYHFLVEKDDICDVRKYASLIKHCHTAALLRRGIPDAEEQDELIRCLRDIGYGGRVSFEFDWLPEEPDRLNHAAGSFREAMKK